MTEEIAATDLFAERSQQLVLRPNAPINTNGTSKAGAVRTNKASEEQFAKMQLKGETRRSGATPDVMQTTAAEAHAAEHVIFDSALCEQTLTEQAAKSEADQPIHTSEEIARRQQQLKCIQQEKAGLYFAALITRRDACLFTGEAQLEQEKARIGTAGKQTNFEKNAVESASWRNGLGNQEPRLSAAARADLTSDSSIRHHMPATADRYPAAGARFYFTEPDS